VPGWPRRSSADLPLAISFFTFQQIAYLVDAYGGHVSERDPLNYALFITFCPHLIAGPITHHREMLAQFSAPDRFRLRWDLVAIGLTSFLIGLFKKVMVADPLGVAARPIFVQAEIGGVQFIQAWTGALSYALQIYFDFSGYTDMAIGLGLLFGISLPHDRRARHIHVADDQNAHRLPHIWKPRPHHRTSFTRRLTPLHREVAQNSER
jgi:D-alanyl-lipoteichoic acid acyltransferase DltB (MBOAT superfamily)